MPPALYAFLAVGFFAYGAIILGTLGASYAIFDIGLIWYAAAALGSFAFLAATGKLVPQLRVMKAHPADSLRLVLFGTGDGLFWFLSLLLVGLSGNAVAGRLSYFLVVLYGFFILKERLTPRQMALVALMLLAGLLFVPGLAQAHEYLGYGLAVAGAVCSASFFISKKHSALRLEGLAPYMLRAVFILLCIAALRLLLEDVNIMSINIPLIPALLFASGGVSNAVFGQYMRMRALRGGEKLIMTTAILSILPVILFLYGIFVLGEDGNIWKYSAAILMLVSVIGLKLPKIKNKNETGTKKEI